MKKYNDEESRELGKAVGTIIGMYDRARQGDYLFTLEEVEKLGKSAELLSKLESEEIAELFRIAGEE